jgi:hypothetical protein
LNQGLLEGVVAKYLGYKCQEPEISKYVFGFPEGV